MRRLRQDGGPRSSRPTFASNSDDCYNPETVKREGGALIVTVWMPVDEWLTNYLLTFGTQLEVIEPLELRPMLAELGKAIYEKYRD